MICCYENFKSPNVLKEIEIFDFINCTKNPAPDILSKINQARSCYQSSKKQYDKLKAELPCFTLNFRFSNSRENKNIKESTGYIYLDIDGDTNIDMQNPYIFSTWLSLSGTGRGVLVKVENVDIYNFKDAYRAISLHLKVDTDNYACKASQANVHSYDKDIYVNHNASIWVQSDENKENYFAPNYSKLNKRTRKDRDLMGETIRYNNYDEEDFKGRKYLYYPNEKVQKSVFINKAPTIPEGKRNTIISSMTHQLRALNPSICKEELTRIIKSINRKKCKPPLEEEEINSIIYRTMMKKDIEPILNNERRFLFNPEFNLSRKDKQKIVGELNGKARSKKTLLNLYEVVKNWCVETDGKLTQKTLIKKSGRNKKTVEKYYRFFKDDVARINKKVKLLKTRN